MLPISSHCDTALFQFFKELCCLHHPIGLHGLHPLLYSHLYQGLPPVTIHVTLKMKAAMSSKQESPITTLHGVKSGKL